MKERKKGFAAKKMVISQAEVTIFNMKVLNFFILKEHFSQNKMDHIG